MHDHSHLSLTCMTIGLYYLLLYTHRNTQHKFPILPNMHNHLQFDIESQYQGTFHLKFGRLSKIQAQRVYAILGPPLTKTADNRFSCSTELAFLIFLK